MTESDVWNVSAISFSSESPWSNASLQGVTSWTETQSLPEANSGPGTGSGAGPSGDGAGAALGGTNMLETGLIVPLYVVIFILSVVGNSLVLVTLAQKKRMRTVTNVYLLNLAVSDLLLGVFCMPFTLLGQLLRNFVFGAAMCKLIPYFQAVSVSVGVWTLVAISLERYFAICRPLKSRRWQTQFHAYKMIAVVWLASCVWTSPILAVSRLKAMRDTGRHKCREEWSSLESERAYNLFLDAMLLLVPLLIMSLAYLLIVSKLWRGLKREIRHSSSCKKAGTGSATPEGIVRPLGSNTILPEQQGGVSVHANGTGGAKGITGRHHSRIWNAARGSVRSAHRCRPSWRALTGRSKKRTEAVTMCLHKTGVSTPSEQWRASHVGGPASAPPTPGSAPNGPAASCLPATPVNGQPLSDHLQLQRRLQQLQQLPPETGSPVEDLGPDAATPQVCPLARHAIRSNYMDKSIEAKKKVIRMLFVVVAEFFVCWAPLHVLNTWYLFSPEQVYSWVGSTGVSLVQLMAYVSSCCNPITYCFMNRKFRQAFIGVFDCYNCGSSCCPPVAGDPRCRGLLDAQHTSRAGPTHSQHSDQSPNDSTVYAGRGPGQAITRSGGFLVVSGRNGTKMVELEGEDRV